MNNNTLFITIGVLIILIAGGAVAYNKMSGSPAKTGVYDTFAQCLSERGAKFYGAFWCPHCQNQKKAFGTSAQYIPYTECSTPDGQGQMSVCADAKIVSYPTWVFADGTQETGEVSMQKLADHTSCELPATLN